MTLDPKAFRHALGHFPTGVVVVTAHCPNGEAVAMTVSSFNAVSLDPPLVLFSVDRKAPSLTRLLQAERFGISVLRRDQSEISDRCAGRHGDKWSALELQLSRAGCPLIGPCLASFECSPFATHGAGDHIIVVGRVESFETAESGEPLVFFRGRYHALSGQAAA